MSLSPPVSWSVPDGGSWPRISIVTPNFNQGASLEATILSVLNQNYPNLEYIIIDGGSTDNSVEVIRKYQKQLKYWVSEKDRGQSHALNKGFAHCAGDVVSWLCGDDVLEPGALDIIGRRFAEFPKIDVVVGRCRFIYTEEGGREWIMGADPDRIKLMPVCNPVPQSSCFHRRYLLDRSPPVDESFHYAMDSELWNYFRTKGAQWDCIPDVLSTSLMTAVNKTSTGRWKIVAEFERIYRRYVNEAVPLTFWYRLIGLPIRRMKRRFGSHRALDWVLQKSWRLYTELLAPFYGRDRVEAMNWHFFFN